MTSQRAGEPVAGEVARHWLAAQQAIVGRASHEVKNALNAVSVNLAVVQSRLRRQQAAEAITSFADTAVGQLELLTTQVEALLALTRELPPTADVGVLARQLATVLGRPGENGSALVAHTPDAGVARTSANVAAVHAIVGHVLVRGAEVPGGCECTVAAHPAGDVGLVVRATGAVPVDDEVAALARAVGVSITTAGAGEVTVKFPPAPGRETA